MTVKKYGSLVRSMGPGRRRRRRRRRRGNKSGPAVDQLKCCKTIAVRLGR